MSKITKVGMSINSALEYLNQKQPQPIKKTKKESNTSFDNLLQDAIQELTDKETSIDDNQ